MFRYAGEFLFCWCACVEVATCLVYVCAFLRAGNCGFPDFKVVFNPSAVDAGELFGMLISERILTIHFATWCGRSRGFRFTLS